MLTINYNQRFYLRVQILKSEADKLEGILVVNGYLGWVKDKCAFINMTVYLVPTNIRKAEVLRQLIKNIKVYDLC